MFTYRSKIFSLSQLNKTAILVFANSAKTEMLHKPIPEGEVLFEALTAETLKKVKQTGLPYFQSTEKQQNGTSFGERFVNAIQDLFSKGYDNIITIGNDSPQLKTAHLIKTHHLLQQGKTVLGPTFDGGFYLMGLNKDNFNAKLFKELPWQQLSLFNKISLLFHQNKLHLFKLPVFQDIDVKKDLFGLLNFSKHLSLTINNLLAFLCFKGGILFSEEQKLHQHNFSNFFFNKGSPLMLMGA